MDLIAFEQDRPFIIRSLRAGASTMSKRRMRLRKRIFFGTYSSGR